MEPQEKAKILALTSYCSDNNGDREIEGEKKLLAYIETLLAKKWEEGWYSGSLSSQG